MRTSDLTRIILSGGPGAGKSTLLHELQQRGFIVSPEVGRSVIQHQRSIDGRALPWRDREHFAELMLSHEIGNWHAVENQAGPVFFDRGIPDVAGYLTLIMRPVPAHLINAINRYRYASTVFLLPPWQAIYRQDDERKQSWQEAVETYETLAVTYRQYGYQFLKVPFLSIEARADFILQQI